MKFTGILATLFLAGTAMACANGPYDTGSVCPSNCEGAQRCGDENHVVSWPKSPYLIPLPEPPSKAKCIKEESTQC
jgi:hypothetical protein